MGIGIGTGTDRAQKAKDAISSPLLDVSITGAGILFNITGGMDITMKEVDEAANIVRENASSTLTLSFGNNRPES